MLVSSHHLSQRGTRKEAPKQGRRGEKERAREKEREREQQLPEMKPGQPASRGRKHKSTGGFAYSEVERRTHTTVQEGPAQLSTSEKRGRGTEEEVGPVAAAAAAAFPSSRGSPHHAPAAAIAARTVFRVPVPSLSRRQHTSSSSLQVVLRYACSFTCSCLLVEMLVCAAEVAGPPLGAERPKMEHSLATIHHFLFRRQHLEPVLVFRLVLARQLLI